MNSLSSALLEAGMPRALGVCPLTNCKVSTWVRAYIRADLTSSMGSTPFFSPSMGSAKRLKASLISPSSCAETLCSLASFERGAALGAASPPPDLRFGG